MNQAVTAKTNDSFDAIKEAHTLSGNPEKIQEYYDKWAVAYNNDVSNEEYTGPEYIVNFLGSLKSDDGLKAIDTSNRNIEILDAGCGTGLVGIVLKQKGYQNIDGSDLSERMVEQARSTGVYNFLESGIDLTKKNEAYENNQYDATVCCGVFTLGHVPPTALSELIRITKPGGWIVVSTRKSYYDSTNFQEVCDRYQQEGKVKLVNHVKDSPYISEEGAHYWAFAVC
ncbi:MULTISPECIES: class I SAM-dependent DNA methyltransferase [Okeania]|uniref:class I SAM-dependent DNA methyltransferase n=1 Tax=Okeania TaxID=1458928 RepID=UPI000F53C42C|nr:MULTISPECIES: class I SAM-dependent methyltransferase [Okeania]NEP38929.1 class I SAM-dependent methyltransferase [Okeania sp. SIO2H7]NEP74431.1 class I SAM-dependent methyltransferase [Okeania sp. SIO2G5]NEP95559.1 class I SAM-dependent methyltransferase [Okeania sp. SIO2F5]NEQ93272.1 class I SAM-dependent methyltransferase [Okeania sp. SIO2G4]RQH26124.1 class I SAM-dependent methyltransferase [Okeania hirsuta]